MWDGKSHDEIRYLRISIKNDENYLENGPLGPIQKSRLKKQIERQKERLKELNKKNVKRKSCKVANSFRMGMFKTSPLPKSICFAGLSPVGYRLKEQYNR